MITAPHKTLRAHERPMHRDVAFYLLQNGDGERKVLQQNGAWLDVEPGQEIVQPTFVLTEELVHELFEQLWSMGYRSNRDRDRDQAGVVEAKDEHLADLRRLLFEDAA